MPRSENGGVIGARNGTSINNATGMFSLKNHFVANLFGEWPRSGNIFVGLGSSATPYIAIYPFSTLGFGSKFSDPASLPPGACRSFRFNSTGKAVAVGHASSPYISAYPWSGSGFGTKYSNPATLPGAATGYGVSFGPNGDFIVVGSSATLVGYPWSDSTGFGTKYSDPSSLPTGSIGDTDVYQTYVAVAHGTNTYIGVYNIDAITGWGAKFSNPATLPAGTGNGIRFKSDGSAVAIAHATSPCITVYPWSGAGYGTKYNNPGTLPAGEGQQADFSPAGNSIVLANNDLSGGANYVTAYQWDNSTGFGTKYSNPSSGLTNTGNGVKFYPNGNYVFFAHTSSPAITGYNWTYSGGFGTKLTQPGTLPGGSGYKVDITII